MSKTPILPLAETIKMVNGVAEDVFVELKANELPPEEKRQAIIAFGFYRSVLTHLESYKNLLAAQATVAPGEITLDK